MERYRNNPEPGEVRYRTMSQDERVKAITAVLAYGSAEDPPYEVPDEQKLTVSDTEYYEQNKDIIDAIEGSTDGSS